MRNSPDRRDFLAAGAALGASLLVPPVARAQVENVKYLTPFGYLLNFFETMYADTGGFFRKNGIEVEIAGGRGSAMAVQQVVAGNFLVSRTGGTDLVKAAVREPSVVAIAEIFQRDLFHVVSAESKPVRSPRDFAGKTVGLSSRGGATENLLDMMLAQEGVPADSVKREVTGDSPGAWEFLAQGRVDTFVVTENQVLVLQQQKKPMLVWSIDRFAPTPAQVYITSRKALAERPEALARFLKGVHDALGALYAEGDLARVIASMLKKYPDIAGVKVPDRGLGQVRNGLNGYRPAWRDKFSSDPAGWKTAYELMLKAKIIAPAARQDFYTDEIRKRAFG
ncbi:MAG: ABC transporter substrate-binding protein [Burkholderiales bacterium]|nr:ABC transporter substrate-binding protein [Burkholderiales bacterium]